MKKLSFIILITFIYVITAQNPSTIKEQATGIKHTLVEAEVKVEKIENKIQLDEKAIEKEIQRRVDAEVKKRMDKEFQKRVEEEVQKRIVQEKQKKSKKKKIVKKIKKNIKNTEKKTSGSSFKEIQYANALINKGDLSKAKSVLNVLLKDKNKILAEEAHFLLIKKFNNVYIPNIQRSGNYNKVLDYKNNTKQFDKFTKKYPKSKYLKDLKKTMKERLTSFNSINKSRNMNLVDLKDSCSIEYKGDSTYICTFKKTFTDMDKKKHKLKINISGKITKYDPSGDMQDEWDTSGLLIDDNALIEITLDGNSKIKYENPIKHKQNPEYELRRVVEYGFSQNKTCVKEHKVENLVNIATNLTDKFIVSNLEVKTHFGRMNELASMDVIYAAKPNGNFFSDRFKSKCYVELTLDER